MKEIERDYDTEGVLLGRELDILDAPTETKGGALYSLWGRVSYILDERDATIARLEADKATLKDVLKYTVLELKLQHMDHKDCKFGVCQTKTIISNARALLAEIEKSND